MTSPRKCAIMKEPDYISPRLDDLGTRLDRIEAKLDNHLERVSGLEKDVSWLRGHARIATTVFLAALGGLGTYLLHYIIPPLGK